MNGLFATDIAAFPQGYTPVKRCGAGAYGEVYLVKDVAGRLLAMKTVSRDEMKGAFQREFDSLSLYGTLPVRHPNLLPIYTIGMEKDYFYYTMPMADNLTDSIENYMPSTLANKLIRQRFPFQEIIETALKLLYALRELHQCNIAHRDIKPDNILFIDNELCLGDIGVVSRLGNKNSLVGTYSYIPPEFWRGQLAVEGYLPQHDLYAVGKVIYQMLTGLPAENFPLLRQEQDKTEPGTACLIKLVNRICNNNPAWRITDVDKVILLLEKHRREGADPQAPPAPRKRLPLLLPAAAAAAVIGAVCLAVIALPRRNAGNSEPVGPAPVPVSMQETTPPPKAQEPVIAPPPPGRTYAPDKEFDSPIATQVTQAIRTGNNADLASLLQEHGCANMELHETSKIRPLHYAITNHAQPQIYRTLMQQGADPTLRDSRGFAAIGLAIYHNVPTTTLAILLDRPPTGLNEPVCGQDETALHAAVGARNLSATRYLLKLGANPDAVDFHGNTPLYKAVKHGYRDHAAALLQAGASPDAANRFGETVLHILPQNDMLAADILRTSPKNMHAKTAGGNNTLLAAVQNKSGIGVIRQLLQAGISPNEPNRQLRLPLHEASCYGDPDVLKLLLENGAAVHSRDDRGFTALHCAVIYNRKEALALLLAAGASPNEPDIRGRTPLHWAELRNNSALAERLRKAGADSRARDKLNQTPAMLNAKFRPPVVRKPFPGSSLEKLRQLIARQSPDESGELPSLLTAFAQSDADSQLKWEIATLAMRNDRQQAFETLLSLRFPPNLADQNGNTLLMEAVKLNSIKLVKTLCHYDIDASLRNAAGKDAVALAAERGAQAILRLLIPCVFHPESDESARRELAAAVAAAGQPHCADLIRNYKPWENACCRENFILSQIRENNVPATRNYLNTKHFGINSVSPLYSVPALALALRCPGDMLRVLLESGACTEVETPRGHTPLMLGAANSEQLKLLLDYGANPDYVNRAGKTVFSFVPRKNSNQTVKLLNFYAAVSMD